MSSPRVATMRCMYTCKRTVVPFYVSRAVPHSRTLPAILSNPLEQGSLHSRPCPSDGAACPVRLLHVFLISTRLPLRVPLSLPCPPHQCALLLPPVHTLLALLFFCCSRSARVVLVVQRSLEHLFIGHLCPRRFLVSGLSALKHRKVATLLPFCSLLLRHCRGRGFSNLPRASEQQTAALLPLLGHFVDPLSSPLLQVLRATSSPFCLSRDLLLIVGILATLHVLPLRRLRLLLPQLALILLQSAVI